MLGSLLKTVVKTTLSFLEIYKDSILERVGVEKQQQSSISCFNPVSWTTCLEKVSINKKGLNAGQSKQQISYLFNSQRELRVANISPLTGIDTFSGVCNGKIHGMA